VIFATVVALAGLALVVVLLFAERTASDPAAPGGGDGAVPVADDHRGPASVVADLATAPLPRAVMGYEPAAVRRTLAVVATAYAELARVVDDDTVRAAWVRAQRPADVEDAAGPPSTPTDRQAAAPHEADGRTGSGVEARDEGADRYG
jgi:hypothetical protein